MIGYLIPEIIIAVFSGTIVNWIKGGVKALQVFGSALKGLKAIKALMNGARGVMNAFEKMGRLFKALGSKIGGALGKAFDNVMDFFKGILKWGDEAPAVAVDDVHAPHDRTPDGPDGKKNKNDRDDNESKAAELLKAKAILEFNNKSGNLGLLKTQLSVLDFRSDLIKRFEYRPDGDDVNVYMIASENYVGKYSVRARRSNPNSPKRTIKHKGIDHTGGRIVKKTKTKVDYIMKDSSEAMNWARKQLGHNTKKIYENGKLVGWENVTNGNKVKWGHYDWYQGGGSSNFPHLNYEFNGSKLKGHLFLEDKIHNTGLMDDFIAYFDL